MNTPRLNADDPKWTAYVLGELDDVERAEIDRLLESSDDARALVEELQVATAALKDELMPAAFGLLPEQRAAIRTAAAPASRPWFNILPAKWAWGLGTAAASLVLMAAVLPLLVDQRQELGRVVYEADAPTSTPSVSSETSLKADASQPVAQASLREDEESAAKETPVTSSLTEQEKRSLKAAEPVITIENFARLRSEASSSAGTLSGRVQDPSGAVIPGVTVTATNTETGVTALAMTNESGAYNFPNLQPGQNYSVSASLPGFRTSSTTGLDVNSAQQVRADFKLQIAQLASSVEVSVDSATLQSAASVGQVLPANQLRELPLVGNNVRELGAIAANSPPPAQGLRDQALTRDGLGVVTPDQIGEARVGEARVIVAPADAEIGRGAAGAGRAGGGGRGAGAAPAAGPVQGVRLGGTFAQAAAVAAAPPPPPPAAPAPLRKNEADLDRSARPSIGTEAYDRIVDNPFIRVSQENFATLSIDVDTASYSNVRRFLTQNQLPPRDAVRIEELINYFSYDYAQPTGQAPIAPNLEVASAPWNPQHRLVRVGIKAREVNRNQRPPSNLVFLVDVSGSMNEPNKLPLLKSGLQMLTNNLGENDFVSMVVYAGASGLVLPPTSGAKKDVISRAIDGLQAGGSTNGGAGIQLAYNQATANFIRNGVNRVILLTDGDFNVGITNQGDLIRLIEQRAKSGVFLSVLGFGMGNLKDSTMEKLADTGNGHYAYIDTINEARKVFVEEMSGTLVTVAKDVKIQVDFNPGRVEAYRLIGYENRVLRTEDFNNDLKDAGDMGAGHTVTALFEIVPRGGSVPGPSIDPSRYQTESVSVAPRAAAASASNEMLTLRVRYKLPEAADSTRMDFPLTDRGTEFSRASQDFRFAAAVASFGMILRDSPYKGNATLNTVLDIATSSRGQDRTGYREEFLSLVRRANSLR